MGNLLLKLLLAEYIVIMFFYVVGRDWPKAAYFLGASILNGAVLWMK